MIDDPPVLSTLTCPFCKESFPSQVVTDHANYCLDASGLADEVKKRRKVAAEALAREVELSRAKGGNIGGGAGNFLRGMVSQNKNRFQEDGFDLDLTYITERLIAMGFPSHGTEGYYRNPIDEVERFFDSRHRGHYRIYNLCSERQYDHPGRFNRAYRRFPFDDHNAPAPIDLVPRLCADASEWLAKDPLNVIAIHCKAGKGRTGVMMAALLMSSNSTLRKADESLKYFGDLRTSDGKGVTIPSQVRYVRYWEEMLSKYDSKKPPGKKLRLDKVVVHGSIKYGGCDPYFLILDGPSSEEIFDSRKRFITKQVQREGGYEWDVFSTGKEVILSGDVKFVFKAKGILFISEDHLFHFWLNTAFAPEHVHLDKAQLDKACKDTKHDTYKEDLVVEVFFYPVGKLQMRSEVVR